ncbi:hypothetical protein [Streptomyces violaceusniger]|nr:hypothetical protein [Streptomyces violaceusniger]
MGQLAGVDLGLDERSGGVAAGGVHRGRGAAPNPAGQLGHDMAERERTDRKDERAPNGTVGVELANRGSGLWRAVASGAVAGADTGRATAAAIAASCAANGDAASWTAAAAAAAYAAHVAADAIKAAGALTAAYATVHDVAAGIAAAHTAAAAGAVAYAAAVAAARGAYAADTVSDPSFVAFSAFAEHPADHHYQAQNAVLLELIGESTGTRT